MADDTPQAPSRAPLTCPKCGASLAEGAADCPKCLLELGLVDPAPQDDSRESVPGGAVPSSTPPTLAEVRAAFPDLEIESLLGRGGMGAVFKARQRKLERTVALKVLPRGLGSDPAFAERFLREARALARLSHPGIVTVHDFGESDGLFFLLMEYVDGLDLRRLLRQGSMDPRQALAIARDLCDALQFAHDEGVVHRDIKPENVLLDTKGKVKIADFGLAKLVHPGADGFVTRADQVMGTPHYMAPEQLERPRDVDHRADIFALGVVLYEMLTGSLPRGHFEPPSHRVHIDVRLDEIVLKALEREPERRYQQALEVKTDVDLVTSSPGPAPAASTSLRPAGKPRPLPPARADFFRGPRALALLVAMWIALAALWNVGPFSFGMAIPLAILVLGGLLQSRVRADPELSAAIDTIPRNRQAVQAVLAVGAVVLGLLAISIGHVLHWERGTEHWGPAFDGTSGWLKQWTTHPSALLFHVGGSVGDVNPIVWLEESFTLPSTSAGAVPPFLLIGFGLLLLAIGISAAIRVPSRSEASRRAWHLGLEISSYVLGALVVLWVGAPIAALRMETTFNGIEQRVESEQPFEVAETTIRQAFLEEGLQVDIEQHLRIDDQASGDVVAHARVYRAQAPSPFDRWSTSFRGPQRESPQVWATLVEHQDGVGSTIVLRGGLYDATSDEIVRARDAVRRIHGALVKL